MPWFWDLVAMSSQIPLSAQPTKSSVSAIQPDPAQEPANLNLHALVLGSGSYVKTNPSVPVQWANTTFQSDSK